MRRVAALLVCRAIKSIPISLALIFVAVNVGAAPAPSISYVSPSSYAASTSNQAMTIYGNYFVSGATLTFISPSYVTYPSNSAKLTFVSSTQINYQFNNGGEAGTWSVRVNNPDTQYSSWVNVTVTSTQPAPTVSSVSPTSMTADGVNHTLSIYGSNFQSGNIVQFKWGVPPNNGVWNTGNSPSISGTTQMSTSMNPGLVNDAIYVRVCRSGSQTTSADCSSGTQFVTVTATQPAPTVSSVSPTSMTADGVSVALSI